MQFLSLPGCSDLVSVCLLCISGGSPFHSKRKRKIKKDGRDAFEGYLWDTCCVIVVKIDVDKSEHLF